MKPIHDPTKYYSQYEYNPIENKDRLDNTYEDYVTFYKNHWTGSKQVDQMVRQGAVNNPIIKHKQTAHVSVDPMWYDWYALNAYTLTALQGIGVFLLLNMVLELPINNPCRIIMEFNHPSKSFLDPNVTNLPNLVVFKRTRPVHEDRKFQLGPGSAPPVRAKPSRRNNGLPSSSSLGTNL